MNQHKTGRELQESRLDELESRLAFQEDTIENLSQVVARQDREILELKLKLAELGQQFREFDETSGSAGDTAGFEVPPHY